MNNDNDLNLHLHDQMSGYFVILVDDQNMFRAVKFDDTR